MPREGGLIGKGVDRIVVYMQAVSHHLDHDATLAVADNPMEQRHAQPLSGRFGDNHRVAQRGLDLIDRRERRCHPQCPEYGAIPGKAGRLPPSRRRNPSSGERSKAAKDPIR